MTVKHWLLGGIAGLGVLVVGVAAYAWWIVARFDTVTPPERYGQVDAVLYVPDAPPRALLVGLGGSEGGNAWAGDRWEAQRTRFLEQGYAFLAVGYFGTATTPAALDRVSVDAVHDAIGRAAADSGVATQCIGVVGGSRGAELALLLASHFPDISATVALVPASVVFPAMTQAMVTPAFSLGGEPLPFVPMPWGATDELLTGDLRGAFEVAMADTAAMAAAAIPVERAAGPLLFVSATQDEMWPSREMADAMMARLDAHAFPHPHAHWAIPGGHAEPLDAFPRIEAFLDEHLAAACD